jgi:hypothetical protein
MMKGNLKGKRIPCRISDLPHACVFAGQFTLILLTKFFAIFRKLECIDQFLDISIKNRIEVI